MSSPVQFLSDSTGTPTSIRIERVFTVSDPSGSATSFDPMAATWLGGYDGSHVARTTAFNLRGIPPGNYDLYLYGVQEDNSSGTTFYVQVNSGSIQVKAVTPQSDNSYVEYRNYARFNIVLTSINDLVRVTVVGFLNGMQLKRV